MVVNFFQTENFGEYIAAIEESLGARRSARTQTFDFTIRNYRVQSVANYCPLVHAVRLLLSLWKCKNYFR